MPTEADTCRKFVAPRLQLIPERIKPCPLIRTHSVSQPLDALLKSAHEVMRRVRADVDELKLVQAGAVSSVIGLVPAILDRALSGEF